MNERQASLEGLQFEGATARPWDEKACEKLRKEAAEIRKMGFRAVVVQSGSNEWGGGSKLLYVEYDYAIYKWLKYNEARIDEQREIALAEERCREIMEEARKKQAQVDEQVAEARAKLAARQSK